jgi:uncharacterized integral membrane protein
MIILFIIGWVLGGVAVIFTLQNIEVVMVSFFSWQFLGSLSAILSVAVAAGVFATLLIILPESIGNYFKYRNLKSENEKLTKELRKQKELTVFVKETPPTPAVIAHIQEAVIIHPS